MAELARSVNHLQVDLLKRNPLGVHQQRLKPYKNCRKVDEEINSPILTVDRIGDLLAYLAPERTTQQCFRCLWNHFNLLPTSGRDIYGPINGSVGMDKKRALETIDKQHSGKSFGAPT